MAILGSVLFGLDGNYNIGGIRVEFVNQQEGASVFGNNWFAHTVDFLLNKSVVRLLTFGYLHVFIHEMGHALAAKINGVPDPLVHVYTSTCRGDATGSSGIFFTLAGPILGMVWEIARLAGAIALAIFLPPSIGLPLGIFIGAGAVFWLFGELMYACSGNGDWARLKG